MADRHEIIVTTRENPEPRTLPFEDLYPLRDKITSMMYLWNANCYYVDVVNRVFIINGGRKLQFHSDSERARVFYRRRYQVDLSMNDGQPKERRVYWLLGFENSGSQIFLQISGDGKVWEWKNTL